MRARIIFLFVLSIPFFIFADEFKLTNMGDGYFFFPDAEVDYVLNAAYLTHIQQPVIGTFIEYQNLQYQAPQPISGLDAIQNLWPDTRYGYERYRSQRIYGFMPSWLGTFAFDLRRNHFIGRQNWLTHNYRATTSLVNENKAIEYNIELAFARAITQNLQIGFHITPFSTEIFTDTYRILNFNYANADLIDSPRNIAFQLGATHQISKRLQIGLAWRLQRSRWQIREAAEPDGKYNETLYSLITDWSVSQNGNLRLYITRRNFSLVGSQFIPYSSNILINNENFSIPYSVIHGQSFNGIWQGGIAYSVNKENFQFVAGFSNEMGRVKINEVFPEIVNHQIRSTDPKTEWIYRARLIFGWNIRLNSLISFQTGLAFGGISRKSRGVFSSERDFSLTRVPTFGFNFRPMQKLEIGLSVLPANGSEIVNSSRDGKNFYRLSLRYGFRK